MRKPYILFALVLILFPAVSFAQQIGEDRAEAIAEDFFNSTVDLPGGSQRIASRNVRPALALKASSEINPGQINLYVFNGGAAGFVVVSGDERTGDLVLGYSEECALQPDCMPENLKAWLDGYSRQIDFLREMDADANSSSMENAATSSVSPLLGRIEWDQGEPFNEKTPKDGRQNSLTGCVATAMSQIMFYHQWPLSGKGSHSYKWKDKMVSSDFSTHEYRWDLMQPKYTASSSRASRSAVAQLMFDCGVSVEMDYSASSSAAYSYLVMPALLNYFDYASTMRYLKRDDYADAEWELILRNELDNKRPVYYDGSDEQNGGGHAFVCDGYDENGFFHYNWGWSGMGNGYFKSSALNVYDYKFNSGQSIVVGIQIPEDIWQDDGWQEYGTGTYGFTCLGNDRQSLNVFGRVSKDGQYQELKVSDWGKGVLSDDGVEVRFVINHATDEVTIPPFNTGYYLDIDSTSFQVCGADVSSSPVYDDPYSVYDFRSRTIRVKMAYYSFTGPSEWVVYNPAIEVFKLPENTPVYMRKVVFDDAAAEAAAVARWDTDKDGKLNYSEIWAVTDIGDAFAGDSSIVSLDVLSEFSNLRVIPENAFSMCKALERLNIPESVNEIGAGAFSGCGSLKTLTLPQGMRDVQDRMCEDCVSLVSLSLPDSLTSIGSRAFRNCKSLREIVIPETVRSIGEMALAGCGNLFIVQVRWSNPLSVPQNVFAWCNMPDCNLFVPFAASGLYKSADVWKDFGYIGSGAEVSPYLEYKVTGQDAVSVVSVSTEFSICDLIIPDRVIYKGNVYDVTSIGAGAFQYNQILQSVVIPGCVRNIGANAFGGCVNLLSISIMDGVESVGKGVLDGCKSLASLHIPASLVDIPYSYDKVGMYLGTMTGLQEITVDDTNPALKSLDGVLFTKDNVLLLYPGGRYDSKYVVPEGVRTISGYAFSGCRELSEVELPASVAEVSSTAFNGAANSVMTLISRPVTPPACSRKGMLNSDNIVLYVPDTSMGAYLADPIWSLFLEIRPISEYVDAVSEIEMCEPKDRVWTIQGVSVDARDKDSLPPGIYIVNGRKLLVR